MKKTIPQLSFGIPAAGQVLRAVLNCRLNTAVLAAATFLFCASAFAEKLEPQPIRTYARLLKVLKERRPVAYYSQVPPGSQVIPTGVPAATTFAGASEGAEGSSYSQTLLQVSGVDEADQVKNDGTCIYQLNQNRVLIIRASPDSALGLVQSLDFTNGNFCPQGLFLDSRFLVVVGVGIREPIPWLLWRKWSGLFPYLRNSTVLAKVYDITDPSQPRKVREIEIDGDYVGARKIGSMLYLVSRHYPLCYDMNFRTPAALTLATPGFRDTRHGKGFRPLSPQCCYYLPSFSDPNYLVVAGVDLANGSSKIKMNAYLGVGQLVYASTDNLYLTASRPFVSIPILFGVIPTESSGLRAEPISDPSLVLEPMTDQTDIYKFSLADKKLAFVSAAQVPGQVLNSYSMDENRGCLRVATTCQGKFGGQTNGVYVLDADLNLTGKLENIAPEEKIYSARFFSNRLFLVTFRNVDPLFAIDLSDPANPVLAGQLTLPGYSDFLLPYDENHLVGLGKDAVTVPFNSPYFPAWLTSSYYQGLKLALFDVSDLANPTLLDSVSIGDRGTDSPALHDPHALLFDPARNLLAFPITVAEATNSGPAGPGRCGQTVFQGAYLFKVSPEAGFEFRGSVTHVPEAGGLWQNWDYQVTRLVAIGSDLFTLSSAQVKVNDLETLAEKAVLDLPFVPNSAHPLMSCVINLRPWYFQLPPLSAQLGF